MGGARIGSVNDHTAVLINPAALGKIREPIINILDVETSSNKETFNIINFNLIRSFQIQKIFDKMKKEKGHFFHQRFQMFPSFAFTNFAMGLLAKYELSEEILRNKEEDSSSENKNLFLSYTNDLAFVTGFSLRFLDGRLKVGGSVRFINRVEIFEEINSDETELSISALAHEGFGVGKDIGLIFSLPTTYLPSFSVVIRDVLNTKYDFLEGFFYDRDNPNQKPKQTRQNIDLGFSFFPILGNRKFLSIATEIRDILNASRSQNDKKDIFRKLHTGAELNIYDTFFLRMGIHQRYWTLGFEMNHIFFQWQLTTYGEEIGTKDHPRSDRRFVGKLIFRF